MWLIFFFSLFLPSKSRWIRYWVGKVYREKKCKEGLALLLPTVSRRRRESLREAASFWQCGRQTGPGRRLGDPRPETPPRVASPAAPALSTGRRQSRRGAAAGGGGRRQPPAPLPRPQRKRLRFERCRRRPQPAEPQRAEPPPAAALLPQFLHRSSPGTPARRWRRLLTRVPQSRGLGSDAAGGHEDTGPLTRGGGGVALLPRLGPGSRFCFPPRKAGAAASPSFRFPLAPSLGRSVLSGKQRPLWAQLHSPQGPTTARLLPREPRSLPAPPRQPRGRETPG